MLFRSVLSSSSSTYFVGTTSSGCGSRAVVVRRFMMTTTSSPIVTKNRLMTMTAMMKKNHYYPTNHVRMILPNNINNNNQQQQQLHHTLSRQIILGGNGTNSIEDRKDERKIINNVGGGSKIMQQQQQLVFQKSSSSFYSFHHQNIRTMTVLSKQSKEEYEKQNYSKRMKLSGKPVSPHVTIYSFPIAALSSITNRVTGVLLSLGCGGLGCIELIGGSGSSLQFLETIMNQHYIIGTSAKLAIAFPVSYHYIGAVRHLLWDAKPELLTNEDVEKSSYYLFGSSTVLSIVAALFI